MSNKIHSNPYALYSFFIFVDLKLKEKEEIQVSPVAKVSLPAGNSYILINLIDL